jgi:glyoxylase-like metal-dependent hydrolase (beta-lactamase superfamily II)
MPQNKLQFEQLSSHVHRLNIQWKINRFMAPLPVGVYLIQEADGYKLVDTAAPHMEDVIVKALASFFNMEEQKPSVVLHQINAVYITHFHFDHCGSLQALWELSDKTLPVYSHVEEIPYIQDGKRIPDQKSKSWTFSLLGRLVDLMNPDLQVPCKDIATVLSDCHVKDNTSTSSSVTSSSNTSNNLLNYYHCPGHTPGHCCFYHSQDGILLCGDACTNNPKLEMSRAIVTPDPILAKDSLKRMVKDLEFTKFVPSHDTSEDGINRDVVMKFLGI